MSTQVKFRRGTTSEHASFTGADGEMTVDTDKKVPVIHDGATAGGFPVPGSSDVQKQSFTYIGDVESGSSANAILLSATPSISAYTVGMKFGFVPDANNTGSATVNIDSVGVVTLKKQSGGALVDLEADDLISGVYYEITRVGSFFQVNGGGLGSAAGGTLVPLTRVTASGDSSIEFTSNIDSTYDNYVINLTDVVPSSDSVNFRAKISTNGGTSYIGSAYHYEQDVRIPGEARTRYGNGGSFGAIFITGDSHSWGSSTGEGFGGHFVLKNPSNTALYKQIHFDIAGMNNQNEFQNCVGFGGHKTAGAYNAIEFTFSSGNVESGHFDLYGVEKPE